MTDPVLISVIGAIATVITSALSCLASIRNHKAITRVEKSTNGLLVQRDKDTHSRGMKAQRNLDRQKKKTLRK